MPTSLKLCDTVKKIEVFCVTIPRDTPYLGNLQDGEEINEKGYIVRQGNKTIYPTVDRSILIKTTTEDGTIGWGETYGICAPKAVAEIINDLLIPVVIGKSARKTQVIRDELMDLMRVRGSCGGLYADAVAAIDISLWDIIGKQENKPLYSLLNDKPNTKIPAYISGLPFDTLSEKCTFAKQMYEKGYKGFKIAAVVSGDMIREEVSALRSSLGPEADIMIDMHWKHTANEAITLLNELEGQNLYFAEAPCQPEDINALKAVINYSKIPIAAGEEWRELHEAVRRLDVGLSILQPEIAHTSLTEFLRIGQYANQEDIQIIPHATIGLGIFLAASLHASSSFSTLPYHEYQHSVFDRNLEFVETDMTCSNGYYIVPTGPGLGINPNENLWKYAENIL